MTEENAAIVVAEMAATPEEHVAEPGLVADTPESQAVTLDATDPVANNTTAVVSEASSSWHVGAARDLTVVDDSSWDGSAAEASIFELAGFNSDNPSWEKARKGFLVYDSDNPDLKSSYKLPFALVQDGELVASKAGIRAAASRLPQADLPKPVKDDAEHVVEAYEKKAKMGMFAEMHDTFAAELHKGYPEVPTVNGIDIDELTATDRKNNIKPTFLTLPIAKVGVVGRGVYDFGNRVLPLAYDETLVNEIQNGVLNQRPGGVMGHPDKHTMDTAFPMDQVIWVGAKRVGDTLWGKAYVRDPAVAQFVHDRKSVRGKVATSILGKGDMIAGETAAHFAPGSFKLRRIDLAPPDQASLDLGGDFMVTAEMADETRSYKDKQKMASREDMVTVLAGLSPEDILPLLGEHAQAVADLVAAKNQKRIVPTNVAEMAMSADTTIRAMETQRVERERQIAEMTTLLKSYRDREFNTALQALVDSKIDWTTKSERDKQVVASVREQLRSKVVAELQDQRDLNRADVIIGEQMAGAFGTMLQLVRDGLSGGPAIVPGVENHQVSETDIKKKNLAGAQQLLADYGFSKKESK